MYKYPNIFNFIYYIFITTRTFFSKLLRKIMFKEYVWNVAFQFTESWKNVTLHKSNIIKNPNGRYLADPFVIKRNDSHFCFVEDYSFKQKRACISVYEINDNSNYKHLGTCLKESFHLSYPYLFEYKGDLYMCPETNEINEIRLYICLEFPLKWKYHCTLMNSVSAADTNIFLFDKKWWMLCNLSSSKIKDHNNELHLFSSKNPLSSDWFPHKLNPIILDSRKARNGGLIFDGDNIFRTYQTQGFNLYGQSMGVSSIEEINDNTYKEKNLFSIKPNFFPNTIGTHTYNYSQGLLVFDYLQINTKR